MNRDNFAKTPAEAIQRALDTFGPNGEKWAQGFWGKSAEGYHISANSEKAICFCADGGLLRGQYGVLNTPTAFVTRDMDWEMYDKTSRYVRRAMQEALGVTYLPSIVDFNDTPGRTFPEVKAVFERALQIAKEQEAVVA